MSADTREIAVFNTAAGDQVSLVDVLDHVLNQGIVIRGNLVISLAGVDLVYVGLDAILTSVETAMRHIGSLPSRAPSDR